VKLAAATYSVGGSTTPATLPGSLFVTAGGSLQGAAPSAPGVQSP
jgi:hypothetical protein